MHSTKIFQLFHYTDQSFSGEGPRDQEPSCYISIFTGPHRAVGYVSGYRYVSGCRSRGSKFNLARSHSFVEIDYEIIFTVILLPSTESFKVGCCQLYALVQACPGKSVVRWTDHPAWTISVDLGCNATSQTDKQISQFVFTRRWYIDKLGIFHANKHLCLDSHQR